MESQDNYLSKADVEAIESAAAENALKKEAEVDAESSSGESDGEKIVTTTELRARIPHDDPAMMDFLVAFLRQYLVCDEYQLHLLALWIVHVWTYHDRITTAAYLDVRSPESESGKTRCLQLLNLLCDEPWFATGSSPQTVMEKLIEDRIVEETENADEEESEYIGS